MFIKPDDLIYADGRIVLDIETFSAIVAYLVRIEVAYLAFQTADAISVIQNTFTAFQFFDLLLKKFKII